MAWTENDLNNAFELTEEEPIDAYEAPPEGINASVDPIWFGYVTKDGNGLSGLTIKLYKYAYIPWVHDWRWVRLGSDTTDGSGFYRIYNPFACPHGLYVLRISTSDDSIVEYYPDT